MAAYRAESTISRAIESVLSQTLEDWELIVVDDGSDDATYNRAIQSGGADPRVTVLRQSNAGPGAARNYGAQQARGDYLCILDSDDTYAPVYLERMAALAERAPDAALLSCNATCISPDGSRSKWLTAPELRRQQSFSLERVIRRNDIFIMCAIHADAFRAVGGFSTALAPCEDYDLWLRLLSRGYTHRYTPELLGVYYRMPGSASSNRAAEALGLCALFNQLIQSGNLTRSEKRSAERRIRAASGRADLERRRVERDFTISRRDALRTASAFTARSRRVAGRLMAILNPSWYVRVFADRSDSQLAELYRAAATNPAFPQGGKDVVSR